MIEVDFFKQSPMNLKRLLRSLLLIFILVQSQSMFAQHWVWGRGNKGDGQDGWPVATDRFGNIYCGSVSFGTGDFWFGNVRVSNPTYNSLSSVIKYDSLGNVKWVRFSDSTNMFPVNLATDRLGNVFFLASSADTVVRFDNKKITFRNPTSAFPTRYILIKIDSSGVVDWIKYAGECAGTNTFFMSSYMLAYGAVSTDNEGNAYITGNFQTSSFQLGTTTISNSDATGATIDFFVAKFQSDGSVVWAKSFGGGARDEGLGITVASTGNVFVTGHFLSATLQVGSTSLPVSSTYGTGFIMSLKNDGTPDWAVGGDAYMGSIGIGLVSDDQGNVYATGAFTDSVVKFGGYQIQRHPIRRPSSFTIDAKYTTLYLLKINSTNSIVWSKEINSATSGVLGFAIALSGCGQVWVSGAWMNSARLRKDSLNIDGAFLAPPDSSSDPVFLAGYNLNGTLIGYGALQSGADDQNGIAADPNGNLYLCADYAIDGFSFRNFMVGPDTLTNYNQTEYFYVAKFKNNNLPGDSSITTSSTDTTLCNHASISLNNDRNAHNLIWNTGATTSTIRADSSGTYWVNYQWGCSLENEATDTFHVTASSCFCTYYMPNAFSPNGDNLNDGIKPLFNTDCGYTDYFYAIYDRWGEQVFSTNDPNARWDGTYKGIPMDIGVYMYYFQFKSSFNSQKQIVKGDITLVR